MELVAVCLLVVPETPVVDAASRYVGVWIELGVFDGEVASTEFAGDVPFAFLEVICLGSKVERQWSFVRSEYEAFHLGFCQCFYWSGLHDT